MPESERPNSETANRNDISAAELTQTVSSADLTCPTGETAKYWIGKKIGKYDIVGVLGEGGMGVVFKGHDPLIERFVAIKVLSKEISSDETALKRFFSEARLTGKLSNANVAGIFEVGQEGPLNYLVMEYVAGGSVGTRLERNGKLSVLEATRIMIDGCRGIAAAHERGLVHRDVKPDNLLLTGDGIVKVTDFGLAKSMTAQGQQLTMAGIAVGTPYFMSPEQCEAKAVDARSDIYSLGATYYSLLTGRFPFQENDSALKVMFAHCHGERPDPREVDPAIPSACTTVIARAMARKPSDRYQSVGEMLLDLEDIYRSLAPVDEARNTHQHISTLRTSPTIKHAKSIPRNWAIYAAVAASLLLICLLGYYLTRPGVDKQSGDLASVAPVPTLPPPPSGEPIKVGVLHSRSGTMATSELAVVSVTNWALNSLNERGGLLGRPVQVVLADGKSDPDEFAREAERLIHQENVVTIFGCWTSASRKTVKPIIEKANNLLIYPLQYEGLESSPNVIYMGSAPNQQILPAVRWAVKELGKKRIFLVGSDYVFPHVANQIIRDELEPLGATVVGEEYIPLGSNRVDDVIKKIKTFLPDLILNTINGGSNTPFFQELRAAGFTSEKVPTLSFSIAENEARFIGYDLVKGDYAAWTYFQSLDSPENRAFIASISEKFPQVVVTDPMEAAFAGVNLWSQAVQEANSVDPRVIKRAMLSQRFVAPGGPVRIDSDNQHCYKTPRVGRFNDNGQFIIVWSETEPVKPDPFPPSRSAELWRETLNDLYKSWGNRWQPRESIQ